MPSYLGIDESNNALTRGSLPEIFVAVYSSFPGDIIEQSRLWKKRDYNEKTALTANFDDILEDRLFAQIVVTDVQLSRLQTYKRIQAMMTGRFLQYFDDLSLVIIDGQMPRNFPVNLDEFFVGDERRRFNSIETRNTEQEFGEFDGAPTNGGQPPIGRFQRENRQAGVEFTHADREHLRRDLSEKYEDDC